MRSRRGTIKAEAIKLDHKGYDELVNTNNGPIN